MNNNIYNFASRETRKKNAKELFIFFASEGFGKKNCGSTNSVPWSAKDVFEHLSESGSSSKTPSLRTVQNWFYMDGAGISPKYINTIALMFGKDDLELVASIRTAFHCSNKVSQVSRRTPQSVISLRGGLGILEKYFSEANVPVLEILVIFGITCLGLLSYIFDLHSIEYERSDGVIKQVGFIWALNWIISFGLIIPVYLQFLTTLVHQWKYLHRVTLVEDLLKSHNDHGWLHHLNKYRLIYIILALFCFGLAGLVQWFGLKLFPLINANSDVAIDWSTIALVQPQKVSFLVDIFFSGMSYAYMATTFFILVTGYMFCMCVITDFSQLMQRPIKNIVNISEIKAIAENIIELTLKCTLCGLWIAVLMKMQSEYRVSNSHNIFEWLFHDLRSILDFGGDTSLKLPTHYTSFLVILCASYPAVYAGALTLKYKVRNHVISLLSVSCFFVLASYLALGDVAGFTSILILSLIVTIASFSISTKQYGGLSA